MASVVTEPSIYSFVANVDLHLRSQPSGVYLLIIIVIINRFV